MNDHTKGPWHIGGRHKCTTYDAYGQRVSDSFEGVMVTQRSDAECQANARLIAAAPELLEALEWVLGEYQVFFYDETGKMENEVIAFARAAIAKAKGETK